ncbi:MAG: hypothetical protein WCI55_14225 [Armatimonadota bacterium]
MPDFGITLLNPIKIGGRILTKAYRSTLGEQTRNLMVDSFTFFCVGIVSSLGIYSTSWHSYRKMLESSPERRRGPTQDCMRHNFLGGLGLSMFTVFAGFMLGLEQSISIRCAIAVFAGFMLKMLFFLWRIRRNGG